MVTPSFVSERKRPESLSVDRLDSHVFPLLNLAGFVGNGSQISLALSKRFQLVGQAIKFPGAGRRFRHRSAGSRDVRQTLWKFAPCGQVCGIQCGRHPPTDQKLTVTRRMNRCSVLKPWRLVDRARGSAPPPDEPQGTFFAGTILAAQTCRY